VAVIAWEENAAQGYFSKVADRPKGHFPHAARATEGQVSENACSTHGRKSTASHTRNPF
jgi:hypothetical protein